ILVGSDLSHPRVDSCYALLLGITPVNQKISSTSIGTITMSFLNNIIKGSCPDKGSWDLEKYNAKSLVNARCLKYLHYIRVKPEMFIFDFGKLFTVVWKLAVQSAVDALYICQLDPNFDEYDIARALFSRVFTFKHCFHCGISPVHLTQVICTY